MDGSSSDQSPDWGFLPTDLLTFILEKLVPEVSDYVQFAAVCKNWHSAACNHQAVTHKRPFFPKLLIPTKDKSEIHRGFYNAIENRMVNARLHIPYDKRCCGSSHGWLIFTEETFGLILFNPFTGATIHLPPVVSPLTKEEIEQGYFYNHEYKIQKVVLSADPYVAPDDYEALAIFDHSDLAFFRCGLSAWIQVKHDEGSLSYEEITYFKGKFYAASLALLVRLDVVYGNELQANTVSLSVEKLARRTIDDWVHKTYLVGTPYEYMLWIDRYYTFRSVGIIRDGRDKVAEYFEIDSQQHHHDGNVESRNHHFTSRFKVYEVKDMDGEPQLTEEVQTLEDKVVFLGHNDSELVSTDDFPEYKGNRIYYMDDCLHLIEDEDETPYPFGAVDTGVFDLEDQSCKPLEIAGGARGKGHMPPPIWILPRATLLQESTSSLSQCIV